MYDVIIIGAGPAGSTAAKILSEKKYSVLLVEKFRLPRHKSCSGILIQKSMDLIRLYFGEKTPPSALCFPPENRGMIFTDDRGRTYPFEQRGLNVWRSSFDNWLTVKAKESGAQVRDCTMALQCRENDTFVSVTLRGEKTYTEEARYVIDCEGVIGTVKRKLADTNPSYITTYQTYNKGSVNLDPHYFYAYLQPSLSEYDAWFNVKDNLLVLGVSVKNTDSTSYYYKQFISYMENRHNLKISCQLASEKWLMPRILPGCPIDYGIGRILFAGETAGFLNPMGEGISAGMESGYHAACAVADNFKHCGSILQDYKQRTISLKSYMERQWDLVAGMADTFKEMKL